MSGHLLDYIAAFLTQRQQCTRVDGVFSDYADINHGVPQGCLLSLLGFLLYVDSVVTRFRHAIPGLYIDDIFAIFSATNPSALVDRMLADFARVYTWGVQRQMIFDTSKFNLVNCFIGKRLRPHHKLRVCFGTAKPQWVSSATLLGVVFDAQLSSKAEVKRVAEKTNERTYRVFNHVDWTNGLGVARLLEIYSIWIESVIAYGSPVWIFQVFPDIRLSADPAYGYGDLWT